MSERGIYYIAIGEQFVQEAEISAQSVRDAMPEMPIAIASDVEPNYEFDDVVNISEPKNGFVDQIDYLHRSPFDRTIFFDTDIYVETDVTDLFDLLSQFDIGAAINHNRERYNLPNVPNSFPEYNSGVVVYRNNRKFHDFTQAWKKNYMELTTEDDIKNQPPFRKTLFESDLRIGTLTPEYNCMLRYPGHVRNEIKIAHSRLLDIQTAGSNKQVDVEKSVVNLNRHHGHRLYVPDGESGVNVVFGHLRREAPIHAKAINSIQRDGFIHTIKNGVPYLFDRLQKSKD